MHGRVRRIPFADQLVRLVHAEVVLVAVEALIVPLRPARVLVLLGILGGLLFPSLGRLAGLDRLVLLLGVALLGHRHNRGVNDLSAARNVALGLKMLAEAFEQLVDQPGLRLSLMRAFLVVNCQSALVWLALRSCSQAAISSMRICLLGMRRSRHWDVRTPSSDSARLSQLPCFGV